MTRGFNHVKKLPWRFKREESLNYKVGIPKDKLTRGKPNIAQMAGSKIAFNPNILSINAISLTQKENMARNMLLKNFIAQSTS
jgi:hypothetical protein